jgi:hypothetical protein
MKGDYARPTSGVKAAMRFEIEQPVSKTNTGRAAKLLISQWFQWKANCTLHHS